MAGPLSPIPIVTVESILGLLVLPCVTIAAAAAASRRPSGTAGDVLTSARRFVYCLVPLGFGMWLAHYSFHFFTSAGAVIPAVQRFAHDLGLSWAGTPRWAACCAAKAGDWLLVAQISMLDLGLLGALHAAYRVAEAGEQGEAEKRNTPRWREAPSGPSRPMGTVAVLRAFVPWAAIILLLFAVGIWILFQPMQMRGTMTMDVGSR